MDSTTIAATSMLMSDSSIMYSPFAYEWWMGPTLFTLVSLSWARFWPFESDDPASEILGRPALIVVCLFLSMVAWIIGGIFK